MNHKSAKAKLISYLKEHNIKYVEYFECDNACIVMRFEGYERCPEGAVEASIFFFDDCVEARVHYTQSGATWAKKSEHISEVYRLLNFINARVFPMNQDGVGGSLYQPQHLYTPKFYITEDGNFDITSTTVINNDFYELAELETGDFITITLPELLDELSIPIYFTLLGKMGVEEAIVMIKKEILKEE